MDIFSAFATDETAEVEGRWFPISKTAKLLVARAGNADYLALLRKRLDASGIDLTGATKEDDAAAEVLFIDVMASTILKGWEGVSFKGEVLPYSVANARTLLGVKDFRKKVSGFSDTVEAFRLKADEALGNA